VLKKVNFTFLIIKLNTQSDEENLLWCMYSMHDSWTFCPGSIMAERHQILYTGFSKPGYHNNRSTVSDHGKLNSIQPFNRLRDLKSKAE
jgi:hypothetical protein